MNILCVTTWGTPGYHTLHKYVDKIRKEVKAEGGSVDIVSNDPWKQITYINNDLNYSINREKIKLPLYHELKAYFSQNYKGLDEWILWREIERYSFELAMLYLIEDWEKYDLIFAQDAVAARAAYRVKPAGIPLITAVHSTLIDELKKDSKLLVEGTIRGSYVAAEEHHGLTSSDFLIVNEEISAEIKKNYQWPDNKMITYDRRSPDNWVRDMKMVLERLPAVQ
jgi:hypothetical protein